MGLPGGAAPGWTPVLHTYSRYWMVMDHQGLNRGFYPRLNPRFAIQCRYWYSTGGTPNHAKSTHPKRFSSTVFLTLQNCFLGIGFLPPVGSHSTPGCTPGRIPVAFSIFHGMVFHPQFHPRYNTPIP